MKTVTTATRRRGFTLIELLVVLTLMSVISTIGMTGFLRMTTYWNDLQADTNLNKDISRAFISFADDFENLLAPAVCGVSMVGKHADVVDNTTFWRISFEDDSIAMPVEVFNPLSQQRERLLVTYAVERDGEAPVLVRSAVTLGEAETKGGRVAVANNIVGMRLRYFDGNQWHNTWNASMPPKIVRVSLSAIDGGRVDRNVSRTTAFAIKIQ